jgi:hypothetical protein
MICSVCGQKVRGRPTFSGVCRACTLAAREKGRQARAAAAEATQEAGQEDEPAEPAEAA